MLTKVSEEQLEGIFLFLKEMQEDLRDKSENIDTNKISIVEKGWLLAIDDILGNLMGPK